MKDWLAILLIYVDFREGQGMMLDKKLVDELNDLFGDISKASLSDNSKIFVVINRVKYIVQNSVGVVSDKTFVYEVIKRPGKLNKLSRFQPLMGSLNGKTLPHSVEPLSKIFNGIQQSFPAEKVFLMTHDHGSAFGIFNITKHPDSIEITDPQNFHQIKEVENSDGFADELFEADDFLKSEGPASFFNNELFNIPVYKKGNQSFVIKGQKPAFYTALNKVLSDDHFNHRVTINAAPVLEAHELQASILSDDIEKLDWILEKEEDKVEVKNLFTANSVSPLNIQMEEVDGIIDILTNEELSDAIKTGFAPRKRVDILIMMNCTMMNMHSAFAFKEQVHHFIAPQGIISRPGYNYTSILNKLMNTAGINPADLAAHCLESTFDFSQAGRNAFQSDINKWAIFSIDMTLTNVKQLALKIQDFAKFLLTRGPAFSGLIQNARGRTFRFDDAQNLNYNMIDLFHFMELLILRLEQNGNFPQDVIEIRGFKADISELWNLKGKLRNNTIYDVPWAGSTATNFDASGLSIYYPEFLNRNETIFKYFVVDNTSNFLTTHKNWVEVVDKF